MSALAGVWRFDEKPQVADDCGRMLAAQQIYGPHDVGQWSDMQIALGRRLFRTVPEDRYDKQPLQTADGRLTLVADIRLDNRDELISALELSRADASRLCDAAILLESFQRWDEDLLDRVVGEFAFALWDAKSQKLLLARDYLGQRPMHFHRDRSFFAFATMAKGLHALDEVPYGPDEQIVAEFLTLMPRTGPRSFFKDISRVEPAHIVTVTREGLSSRCYWRPRKSRPAAKDDYVEGLRYHLDQAVASRLRGVDAAVGTHLSAGFDSSTVTATAAKLLASSNRKVVAFTAVPRTGYDGPVPPRRIGDEGPLAALTAGLYPNIEHVRIQTPRVSPLDALDRRFYLFEHPSMNLCNGTWWDAINKAASDRKINIILNAQRGNMSLSYFGLELLPELLRTGRFARLWQEVSKLVATGTMTWRGAAMRTFGGLMPVWLWQWVNETFGGHKYDVLKFTSISAERLADLNLPLLAAERGLDFTFRPRQNGFVYRSQNLARGDAGTQIKGALGGWGIDERDPTVDKRLVEYSLNIPTEQFLSGGVLRALAVRAFSDRLPPAILHEKKRGYQAIDWHENVTAARGEIAAELERLAACPPASATLDIARMQALVRDWPESGWEKETVRDSYRLALLRGISAGHFLRKASGSNQ